MYSSTKNYKKNSCSNDFKNSKTYVFKKFKNIKYKQNIKRIGIIPYIKEFNNKTNEYDFFFCLGVDKHYNELTDFGGFKKFNDIDIFSCANRELKEESNNIFDLKLFLNPTYKFENSLCVLKYIYCTIFVNFSFLKHEIGFFKNKTHEMFIRDSNNEIKDCLWIKEEHLKFLLTKKKTKEHIKNNKQIEFYDTQEQKDYSYPFFYEKIRYMLNSSQTKIFNLFKIFDF